MPGCLPRETEYMTVPFISIAFIETVDATLKKANLAFSVGYLLLETNSYNTVKFPGQNIETNF